LQSKRVDGILISSSQDIAEYSFYEDLINSGTQIVFFDRCIEDIGASCVSVNDRASSRQITEHLIVEHGFSKIAYLSGPRDVSIGRERLEGYRDALKSHGLSVREDWIIQAGFQEDRGYQAMQELLSLDSEKLPEAVVTVNDPCAIGAIRAMEEANLSIPGDIAIVGFTDDIRAPLLSVPLTTVHQPAYEVGKKAAQKLIRTIENENEPIEKIEIPTTLKIRSSCGCNQD
jgi:DNA-binding LacI/PurR family transcriptional regulator